MLTISNRVTLGAQLLDTELPGWYEMIDLEQLDISKAASCILAQLCGSYGRGFEIVMGHPISVATAPLAIRFGFAGGPSFLFPDEDTDEELILEEYAALTETWRLLIRRRRYAAAYEKGVKLMRVA